MHTSVTSYTPICWEGFCKLAQANYLTRINTNIEKKTYKKLDLSLTSIIESSTLNAISKRIVLNFSFLKDVGNLVVFFFYSWVTIIRVVLHVRRTRVS